MKNRGGFTLIELLVVIGIIAVLVVVVMVALLPALLQSKHQATKSLLNTMGGALAGMRTLPNKTQFNKDAGQSLANTLDWKAREKGSSQLIVFYLCPSRDVWNEAPLYKNRDYQPTLDPAQYKDMLLSDDSSRLQYMADAWGTPLWYVVDKMGFFLISAGEDMKFDTKDDWIYDSQSNNVAKREDMAGQAN